MRNTSTFMAGLIVALLMSNCSKPPTPPPKPPSMVALPGVSSIGPAVYCVGLTPPESAWPPPVADPDPDGATDVFADAKSDSLADTATDLLTDSTSDDSADVLLDGAAETSADGFSDPFADPLPDATGDVAALPGKDSATDTQDGNDTHPPGDVLALPEATVDTAHDADVDLDADAGCTGPEATCPGAPMPFYTLEDFQPKSCGYKAFYGLELYTSKVTVVSLLASW
jgi:hypothetical protein